VETPHGQVAAVIDVPGGPPVLLRS
jgi:hypothetical protein